MIMDDILYRTAGYGVTPLPGSALALNPDGKYPVGSLYPVPA